MSWLLLLRIATVATEIWKLLCYLFLTLPVIDLERVHAEQII